MRLLLMAKARWQRIKMRNGGLTLAFVLEAPIFIKRLKKGVGAGRKYE